MNLKVQNNDYNAFLEKRHHDKIMNRITSASKIRLPLSRSIPKIKMDETIRAKAASTLDLDTGNQAFENHK